MGLYKNTNGVLSPIAGRGKAEYGASTIRKGTITLSGSTSGGWWTGSTTFSEPMPDDDYLIIFEPEGTNQINVELIQTFSRTANGFSAQTINPQSAGVASWAVKYTAFKLYTDKEYNDILAAMPSDASASNKLVTEGTALKVKVKEETITTNSSGYLFLPKGTFAASVNYKTCLLLAWSANVISKAYVDQATSAPTIGTFNPNTSYSVRYHYIET